MTVLGFAPCKESGSNPLPRLEFAALPLTVSFTDIDTHTLTNTPKPSHWLSDGDSVPKTFPVSLPHARPASTRGRKGENSTTPAWGSRNKRDRRF